MIKTILSSNTKFIKLSQFSTVSITDRKKSDEIDYFGFHFQVVLITCGQSLPNRWILRSKCYHAEETLLQLSDRQIFWLCLTE